MRWDHSGDTLDHLCNCDPKLGTHIKRIGTIERDITPDIFQAPVESIISQQTSGKAAATVSAGERRS